MSHIGEWAHRAGGGKSHLIESEVADRFVMRCGKEMRLRISDHPGGGLIFENPGWAHAACVQCAGGRSHAVVLNDQPTLDTRGPDDRD